MMLMFSIAVLTNICSIRILEEKKNMSARYMKSIIFSHWFKCMYN